MGDEAASVNLSSGFTQNVSKDGLDRLDKITLQTTGSYAEEQSYTYLNGSSSTLTTTYVSKISYGNASDSYTYDDNGNVKPVTTADGTGNISTVKETINGTEHTKTYTYDKFGRLTKEGEKSYVYNENGRMIRSGTDACRYDNRGRLIRFGTTVLEYDNYGNRTKKNEYEVYTWERGNKLKRITKYPHTEIEYTYDYTGQRSTKSISVGGVQEEYIQYHYDGNNLVGEDRTGGIKLRYFYDAQGICGFRYINGNTTKDIVYVKNIFGDVEFLQDSSGNVLAQYTYDAWGKCSLVSDTDGVGELNPIRYRGYYYDTESKLYYLLTRYYDPETATFITPDSVDYLDPETIGGIDLYAYCRYNPVMNIDPTGEFLLSFLASLLIASVVGAVVGIAGTFVGDLVTSALTGSWQFSSWETYIGAAIGSAVGGAVSLFNPFAGVVLAGTLSTFAGHAIGKITGSDTSSWLEIGVDTMFSLGISVVTAGMSRYLKIPGITKGSHSFQQVFKSSFTKALRYQFSMSMKTLAKETVYLLVSGFTSGFFASSIVQGVYNAAKICLQRLFYAKPTYSFPDINPYPTI